MNLVKLKNMKKNLCLQTFLWGVGLSFLFFIPWIIYNGGYFFFYGDFNVQQIPFYQMIHDSVLDGNIGWSYTTDLGANIIGSYSFYMIGSPFFWFTLLFPSKAVPYLIAPMLMLKFGLAALGAYLFMRRYVRDQHFAMFGALLYAFSGFGIYNIFFNHFHEAMITFPFLLAAVDTFIYERKKGVVALTIFASAFISYYFFAGQSVFLLIYWSFRMVTGSYRMKVSEFFRFLLEVLLAVLSAGAVLLPAVLAVIQNSRLDNFPHGWAALAYPNEQRYLHIILSFFFPPDMPAYANFTPDSNAKWASVAGWLPVFSMVGVFSFYRLHTQKWLRKLIPVLFIMALVPVLNCTFQLLNITYYARWFYMPTLMLSLATVICLDHSETDYKTGLIRTSVITGAFTILIGFMPEKSVTDKDFDFKFGLAKYPDRFWGWVAIALIGLAVMGVLVCLRKNTVLFKRVTAISLSIFIVGYSTALIGVGVVNANYQKDFIADSVMDNADEMKENLPDSESVRVDFYEMMDNMGMFWKMPTIQAFQSIVPGSVMDFYKSIGVERSVGSRPKTDVYGIRSLLSVKYLIDYDGDKKSFCNKMDRTEMPGWKKYKKVKDYTIYENEYYIPYGFSYNGYITREEFEDINESDRHLALLKAIVLDEDQAVRHSDILSHLDTEDFSYFRSEYYDDCLERRDNTCTDLKFENNRFSAKYKAGSNDELVFFSIPYESGWSATVNGKDALVEVVNEGFMAVRVPANQTSEIVFTYQTPGLAGGVLISLVGIVLFVVYMLLWKTPAKKRDISMAYYEDDEDYVPSDYDMALYEEYDDHAYVIPIVSPDNNDSGKTGDVTGTEGQSDNSEDKTEDNSGNKSGKAPDKAGHGKKSSVRREKI